ncbi:hypothetical protein J1614_010743 [Plenodomus biglobosus]|nr:hypothetical protein J1614_010743 [Plenodomus biglobosus]
MTSSNGLSKAQSQQAELPPESIQANPQSRPHQNRSINAPVRGLVSAARGPSEYLAERYSSHETRKMQQQQHPRPQPEASLDAIQQLNSQIPQNRGALASHARNIRFGEKSFGYLEETLRWEFSSQTAFQNAEL